MDAAFDTKDALIDALLAQVAAASPGDPFFEVEVHPSWPEKGVQGNRSVLVLDIEGDETPATMRAGGGTRDDRFRIDVVVAVWDYESDARVVRAATKPLVAAVKALVRAEGAASPGGVFGVARVRQPEVRSYRVAEYVVDKGRRECDVHLVVSFIARVNAT